MMCIQPPIADAIAIGTRDLTLNSNVKSSIARNMPEIGVPKAAARPAPAPVATRILLSVDVTLIS